MIKHLCSVLKSFFQKINNIVFYKTFIIIVIAVTLPVISISLLAIRHSTENITRQVRESSINNLSDKKSIIDQRIREIDTFVYQINYSSDLNKLKYSSSLSNKEYFLMIDIIKDLANKIITNELIESIYIYDAKNDYILSDSKYTKDNFDDIEIINLGFETDFQVVSRQLNNKNSISYVRKFDDFMYRNTIIIVVNIDYNGFFNIYPEEPDDTFDIFIFDDKYSEILLMSNYLDSIDQQTMEHIMNHPDSSGLFDIGGVEYFICKVRSGMLDWNITYVQPYSNIIRQAQLLRNLIITSLFVVLALSFILAYIFSKYLYKPLALLAFKAGKHLKSSTGKVSDAYKLIDDVLIKLFDKNNELASKYQKVFPYFKEHSLYDVLSGETCDTAQLTNVLNLLGIHFRYSGYVNILVDFENSDFSEELKEYVDSYFAGCSDRIVYIITKIGSTRASFIVNSDLKEEDIHTLLTGLKTQLNSQGIVVTIAIGEVYDSIDKTYLYHKKVLEQIESKFFTGKDKILLGRDACKVARKFVYDKKLEEKFISCLISQDNENAVGFLKRLIGKIVDNNGSIEYIKYVYFQVIFNAVLSLDNLGIDPEKSELSRAEIFDSIQKSDTFEDLQEFAENTITKCIRLIAEYKKMQHDIVVEKTLQFLESNYAEDVSLDEVAKNVFLSPRYLNNIFKSATGCTIYEYVTKLRMEKAMNLLLESDGKVHDIASRVGYNSIQSFLRLFKKYNNMTPVEYRRRYG